MNQTMNQTMSHALAIFRKDARHLRPQLALWFALVAAQAITGSHLYRVGEHGPFNNLMIMEVAACYFIATLIHQENLPGQRQYWLARPITGFQILAAKALFLAAFFHLPLLLGHAAQVIALGIAPGDYFPGLLWRQLVLAAVITIPVSALAAATRNLGQFLLGGLALSIPLVAFNAALIEHWAGPWWIPFASLIFATCSAAIAILLLYARRDTVRAGIVMLTAAIVVAAASWTHPDDFTTVAIETGQPQMADHDAGRLPASTSLSLSSWIHIAGAPPTADVFAEAGPSAAISDYVDGRGHFTVSSEFATRASGELYLTMFTRGQSVHVPLDSLHRVDGIGSCSLQVIEAITSSAETAFCLTPMPRSSVVVDIANGVRWVVPPEHWRGLPALFEPVDVYQVTMFALESVSEISFTPVRVLARVRGKYNLGGRL